MVATVPAFAGANFDAGGSCLHHPEIKLAQKTIVDGGRVVYKELRRRCPKCTTSSSHHKNKSSSTSPDIKRPGSIQSYHSHGSASASTHHRRERQRPGGANNNNAHPASPNPSLARSNSRSRPRARSKSPTSASREYRGRGASRGRDRSRSRSPESSSRNDSANHCARSKSPGGARLKSLSGRSDSRAKSRKQQPKKKKEFDTPFDSKGRCHYHSGVQLAKKKLTGGWKVLLPTCPKCMEDKYVNENDADNRSVASRRSNRSSRSVKSGSGGGVGGSGGRKKMLSMKKGNSTRYECPFDNQGYCHRHSHVRLAKKKLTGGWKILQAFCVECAEEDDKQHEGDNRSVCSRSSRYSRKSAGSRKSTGSRKSAGGTKGKRQSYVDNEDETDSQLSTSQSEQNQKKLVKKMNYTDDEDDEGLYTGYVNSQYKPHGSGKMLYNNGKRFSGEWCEGTKVHGKTTTSNRKSKRNKDKKDGKRDNTSNKNPTSRVGGNSMNGTISGGGGSIKGTATRTVDSWGNGTTATRPPASDSNGIVKEAIPTIPELDKMSNHKTKQMPNREQNKQDALRNYKALYNTAQVVKNMLFVDFYGDRGRYTGEVNEETVPHGFGEITYDHGLVQEGKWTNGVLDEDGSVITTKQHNRQFNGEASVGEGKSRRRAKSKDP